MNYRHLFHAGNFADVLKHALLLDLLAALTIDPRALTVLDTHAGAGLYDLEGEAARRTGEAERGVGRLMADTDPPAPLARLKAEVAAADPGGGSRVYPGSPWLAVRALRRGDAWSGCELRQEEAQTLRAALPRRPGVATSVRVGDGYAAAAERVEGRRLVLIDPPFERADEADRVVEAVAAALRSPETTLAVWLPVKDLDGYDRLLSRVEALRPPPSLQVQARLRPLADPMRMNGAALWLIGGPFREEAARVIADWVCVRCGEAGARAVVERFGG